MHYVQRDPRLDADVTVGIDYEQDKIDELLRLTRDNNRILRSMRRSAWLGGIFKLILWVGFFLIPLWLYLQYLAPALEGVLETYKQVQGTSAAAEVQVGKLNDYLKQIQSLYGN